MILVKIHSNEVVSLCDKDILGQIFEEGDLQLDITERFYKGVEMAEEEMLKVMKDADNLNIVGEKSIALAVRTGMIDERNVMRVKGVPHAQVYALK